MRSKRSHEGWFYLENRHAPAERLAHPANMHVVGEGMMGTFESAFITCSHCQRTVVLNPQRDRPRGWCARCDHYICDDPGCNAACIPVRMLLDLAQEEAARAEQAGRTAASIEMLRASILG